MKNVQESQDDVALLVKRFVEQRGWSLPRDQYQYVYDQRGWCCSVEHIARQPDGAEFWQVTACQKAGKAILLSYETTASDAEIESVERKLITTSLRWAA